MAKKVRQTFRTPLHLACSDDELRPVFGYIHFLNGMAYATDAHILVEQSVDLYCDVINKDMLDGHSIHRDAYKFISKCQEAEVIDTGIKCTTKDGAYFFYPWPDMSAMKIPDFKKVMSFTSAPTPVLGISPHYMKILDKVLYKTRGSSIRCDLQGDNGAIMVTVPEMINQCAMWMPVNIN